MMWVSNDNFGFSINRNKKSSDVIEYINEHADNLEKLREISLEIANVLTRAQATMIMERISQLADEASKAKRTPKRKLPEGYLS